MLNVNGFTFPEKLPNSRPMKVGWGEGMILFDYPINVWPKHPRGEGVEVDDFLFNIPFC